MDFVNNYLTELEEFRGDENQLVRHMSNFPIHFRQLFQFAQCTSYKAFLVYSFLKSHTSGFHNRFALALKIRNLIGFYMGPSFDFYQVGMLLVEHTATNSQLELIELRDHLMSKTFTIATIQHALVKL